MADFERKAQSQVTIQVGAVSQASCDFLDVLFEGLRVRRLRMTRS